MCGVWRAGSSSSIEIGVLCTSCLLVICSAHTRVFPMVREPTAVVWSWALLSTRWYPLSIYIAACHVGLVRRVCVPIVRLTIQAKKLLQRTKIITCPWEVVAERRVAWIHAWSATWYRGRILRMACVCIRGRCLVTGFGSGSLHGCSQSPKREGRGKYVCR